MEQKEEVFTNKFLCHLSVYSLIRYQTHVLDKINILWNRKTNHEHAFMSKKNKVAENQVLPIVELMHFHV